MADIREHMKIIGKDGAHVGTVDRVEGNRIKLTRKDSPEGHKDHHHYIDTKYVGAVEGDIVKLSYRRRKPPETLSPFGGFLFVHDPTPLRSQSTNRDRKLRGRGFVNDRFSQVGHALTSTGRSR